jgi:hypothetical protein
MKRAVLPRSISLALACLFPLAAAVAQQSAAPASGAAPAQPAATHDMPTPEQLEPGVNTSAPAPAPSGLSPSESASAPGTKPAPKGAVPAPAVHKGPDRLQLDATEITGNRELPKVLYIVPWKRSDLGDLTGKPVNSLLDEVLEPLDRDVFQRENRYYNGLKAPAAAPPGGVAQGAESKP